MDPLIWGFFSINTVTVFSLMIFLISPVFSRIQYILHTKYVSVDYVIGKALDQQ